ncbi:MAG: glycosyltransferase family 2 protein [Rikenellaceae bacterium]
MIKVSVLVPMYGAEQYIVKCARSLFSQSYPNCEFIFVDDASVDRTVEKLRQTAHEFPRLEKQVKIIELEKNGGVAAARNAALDAATGEYILFVDADDWVDVEIVEKLAFDVIETQADICNAWCESVAADDKRYQQSTNWLKSKQAHIKAILGQSHLVQNHVRGMLIRRSLFEENSLRFTPRVDFGEDYSLLPQILFFAQKIITRHEYLYYYRIGNEASYMNTIGERHINNYVAAEAIVNSFFTSQDSAKRYRRALLLGKINLKKWIFKRGVDPKSYDAQIFALQPLTLRNPLLCLYNRVVDSRCRVAIFCFSALMNLGLYVRVALRRISLL